MTRFSVRWTRRSGAQRSQGHSRAPLCVQSTRLAPFRAPPRHCRCPAFICNAVTHQGPGIARPARKGGSSLQFADPFVHESPRQRKRKHEPVAAVPEKTRAPRELGRRGLEQLAERAGARRAADRDRGPSAPKHLRYRKLISKPTEKLATTQLNFFYPPPLFPRGCVHTRGHAGP